MNISIDILPYYTWKLSASNLEPIECNTLASELSSNPFHGLSEEDEARLLVRITNKQLASNGLILKWTAPKKNSWLSWRATIEGNFIYLFAANVSEIKEEQLYYSQILNAFPDMILVKSKGQKIHWGNKAFQAHYNMDNDELQELIDAPFNSPDLTQQYILDDQWVWDHKKNMVIECEPVTRFDGVVRKFQTTKFPIINSHGEVTFTVGISKDITESMEAKERAYAASKMASLGEMAGAIAHEINNPIAVILGKAHQLRKYINSDMYDKALLNVDSIEVHSNRIAKIIHNLLTFCRDDKTERFEVHPFSTIVHQTLSFSNETLKFHKFDLILELEEVEVECLSVPISQVLLNLINNAIDAAAGSVKPWIKIEVKSVRGNLECRISDSGPGVPHEIAVKIMQPFFTTKPVGKGTGLGLSICQSIAERHGGKLTLDRSVSMNCFLLTLPLKH